MRVGASWQDVPALSDSNKLLIRGAWAGNSAFDSFFGPKWGLASPPPSLPPSLPPPPLYQVLTTDGATCVAGTEITSLAECSAAFAEANAALGLGPSESRTVSNQSYSFYPKGCYSYYSSQYLEYGSGYFNDHATGSGTGTATGTNLYVHCLLTPVLSPPSPPPPDTTTADAGVPPQPQSPCTCAQANAFLRSYASSNTDGCTVTTQNCGSSDFSTWSCSYKLDRSPQYEWTCTDAKALNAGASNVETGSDSSSMGAIIGGAGEQTAPPCNLARDLARRPHGLHRSPHPPPGTPLAAWRSVAYWSAPASTPR